MSSQAQGALAPVRRFLAIFLVAWAIVLAYLGSSRDGSAKIGFFVGAAACLVIGLYCFRSFASARSREF